MQCPIGDFFCGHARPNRINSIPIMVDAKSRFQLLFRHAVRARAHCAAQRSQRGRAGLLLPNRLHGIRRAASRCDALPCAVGRERVTEIARDYTISTMCTAMARVIGTPYLALTALESRWWGEAATSSSTAPSGTQYPTGPHGAEDYFGGAWSFADYFDEQPHAREHVHRTVPGILVLFAASCRAPRKRLLGCGPITVMRGLYRWHIPDPIYFDSDLRVTWQQIGTEEAGIISSGRMTSRRWHTGTSLNRHAVRSNR